MGNIRDYIWILSSHPLKQIHTKCLELSSRVEIVMSDDVYIYWLRSNIQTMVRLLSTESMQYFIQIMLSFRRSEEEGRLLKEALVGFRKVLHQYMVLSCLLRNESKTMWSKLGFWRSCLKGSPSITS